MRKNFAEKIREANGGEIPHPEKKPIKSHTVEDLIVKNLKRGGTREDAYRRFTVIKSIKFVDIPEEEACGSDVFYVELPDGYRLKYENGKYAGRYDPNGTEE